MFTETPEIDRNDMKFFQSKIGTPWTKFLESPLIVEMAKKIKKPGQDDPRRIIHSLKVGLALTLVSLFYYIQPLYDRIGENSIWVVITVILVLEFSVVKLATYLP